MDRWYKLRELLAQPRHCRTRRRLSGAALHDPARLRTRLVLPPAAGQRLDRPRHRGADADALRPLAAQPCGASRQLGRAHHAAAEHRLRPPYTVGRSATANDFISAAARLAATSRRLAILCALCLCSQQRGMTLRFASLGEQTKHVAAPMILGFPCFPVERGPYVGDQSARWPRPSLLIRHGPRRSPRFREL